LRELNLDLLSNEIGHVDAVSVADVSLIDATLHKLRLSQNSISIEFDVTKSIATALQQHLELRVALLQSCFYTEDEEQQENLSSY
jgi:hypothetical protein